MVNALARLAALKKDLSIFIDAFIASNIFAMPVQGFILIKLDTNIMIKEITKNSQGLSERKKDLMRALSKYHAAAALRECASTKAFVAAWLSNGGDFLKSVTSALMTFGGAHGPVKQCYTLIENDAYQPNKLNIKFPDGTKIPGFGSSFIKEVPDPLLESLHSILVTDEACANEIRTWTKNVQQYTNKKLYPNGAFYTAFAMIEIEMPIELSESLMINARIHSWAKLVLHNIQE